MNSEVSAIEEILRAYAAACCTGDFDQWMSLWDEQGVQMPPGAPTNVGVDQIKDAMKGAFETLDLELVIHEIEDSRIIGDIGLTRCRYSLKGTSKDGGELIENMPDGKALTLYARQSDGSWKIVYDCFNTST